MVIEELIDRTQSDAINTVAPDCSLINVAAQLLKNKSASVVVKDKNGELQGIATERDIVRTVNDSPDKLEETRVDEIMTKDIVSCAPGDDVSDVLERMIEHSIRHMPVIEDGRLISIIGVRDVQKICNHLDKLASTDPLTDLANRREFTKAINAEHSRFVRFQTPFSVVTMDIDFFKKINDKHGHAAGDLVLIKFADIFKNRLRAYDLAARVGGEEFGLIFPNTAMQDAIGICEDLLDEIRKIEMIDDRGTIRCTASIGLTSIEEQITKAEKIIEFSDQLLYEAKQNGRDQIVARVWCGQAEIDETQEDDQLDDVFFGFG